MESVNRDVPQLLMPLPMFSLCLDLFAPIAFWIGSNNLVQFKLSICSSVFTILIGSDCPRVRFDLALFFNLIYTFGRFSPFH